MDVFVRHLETPNAQVVKNLVEDGPGDVRITFNVRGVAEGVRAGEVGGVFRPLPVDVPGHAPIAPVDDYGPAVSLPAKVEDRPQRRVEGVEATAASTSKRLFREIVAHSFLS